MKCRFKTTGETHKSGRELLRCDRCRQIGLMPLAGGPEKLHAECSAWPFWHEFGHWAAIFLAAAGIRKGGMIARLLAKCKGCGCGCEEREAKLNSWGAKATAWLWSHVRRPSDETR